MAHVVTCEDLLTRVQELAPVLRAHADQGERERHLMDPVVEALQDAEIYYMLVPRALGGLQVDPLTLYRVVEAVARIDGSTGWCLFINGCAPISAAFLGDDAAETIYGRGARTIIAGSVFPYGRAVPQAGGYRISGHWTYASGCWHSTWFLAFCQCYDDGATAPRTTPTGGPEVLVAHVPRAQTLGGEAIAVAERAAFLLAATNATRSAAAAVELAYTAGEGSANYRRSPLERQLRDIHT